MTWKIILKGGKYTKNNLSMLKDMMDQLLEDTPEGTIFKSVDMWPKYITYKPSDPIKGRSFNHWISQDKAKSWFVRFFGAYGIRMGKLDWHNKWNSELIRLD